MKIQIKTVPERILLSLVFFIKKAYSIYLDNICANSEGAELCRAQKHILRLFWSMEIYAVLILQIRGNTIKSWSRCRHRDINFGDEISRFFLSAACKI